MKYFKILIILIITLTMTLSACSSIPDTPNETETTDDAVTEEVYAIVTNVIDGDTIEVEIDGQPYTVRYIGIDAPETEYSPSGPEPFNEEATSKNRQLIEDKIVFLEKDTSETDQYGRLLRYVYVDSIFVNGELVRLGLAEAKSYQPDTMHQDQLDALERHARVAGIGIWSIPLAAP